MAAMLECSIIAIRWDWDAAGIHVLQSFTILPADLAAVVMLESCNELVVYLSSALW